ncbi:hypothetical protein DevBK_00030 [Devosia sp. BK]|uniref:hypothetical protein n=1 Tax=Devosia sp. BK TaxID=2871706 RepID=UPI00293A0597|nr:hypothetical protein [Devosia sp. BK]MDV3249708.1 hypothetical protein [Devosia sp. BK]
MIALAGAIAGGKWLVIMRKGLPRMNAISNAKDLKKARRANREIARWSAREPRWILDINRSEAKMLKHRIDTRQIEYLANGVRIPAGFDTIKMVAPDGAIDITLNRTGNSGGCLV